ncbi:Alpha/Beta hydrolase protein [Xylariales sp. AK1849]|nr:Alpha/Beta hydrolase protein [Xylariales sp. AK1849]
MAELYTKDTKPFFRQCVHPQDIAHPMTPAPPLKHEVVELEGGKVVFEKDIPIKMRDGAVLYADSYRPVSGLVEKTPTLLLFSPFGKHGAVPREKFQNMGVDFGKLSTHTKWEIQDPVRWCSDYGYSFLSVDPRGTWWSEGDATHLSPEEGRDGYDVVEWIAQQSWSTGNVGWGGGVSYFAMSAYQTAVLRPPHLKAIMAWEGISDLYREVNLVGGIPNVPFQNLWMNMTGNGLSTSDDHAVASIEHPLFDDYWQSKVVDWSLIDIPIFSITGWSSLGLHLRGTIEAWKQSSSPAKFLKIHGGREWSEFYKEPNIQKQLQFWDRYLKDVSNEVGQWPRVEIDVRTSADQSVQRAEPDFPPKGALTRFQLQPNSTLVPASSAHTQEGAEYVSFKAHKYDSVVHFDFKFTQRTEITGFSSVKLFVQAMDFPDVDLFVALQKLDKDRQEVRFYHSTQQIEAAATFGWLRASHRELDTAKSTPERPVHLHRRRLWLQPKLVAEVDVELWPTSTVWEAGETLRLAVKGTTFTDPENLTQFKSPSHSFGEVKIWFGGKYDSSLLVPVVG